MSLSLPLVLCHLHVERTLESRSTVGRCLQAIATKPAIAKYASKMAVPRASHLLELPDEVLVSVFGFLNYYDLREAVCVCRSFNGMSEPFLYNSIQVLNGGQASSLAHSLNANIRRARWVHDLLISTRFGEDEGLSTLPPFIAEMRNLRELRLETPDCNSKHPDDRIGWTSLQDRYERIFGMSSGLVPSRDARLFAEP